MQYASKLIEWSRNNAVKPYKRGSEIFCRKHMEKESAPCVKEVKYIYILNLRTIRQALGKGIIL